MSGGWEYLTLEGAAMSATMEVVAQMIADKIILGDEKRRKRLAI